MAEGFRRPVAFPVDATSQPLPRLDCRRYEDARMRSGWDTLRSGLRDFRGVVDCPISAVVPWPVVACPIRHLCPIVQYLKLDRPPSEAWKS